MIQQTEGPSANVVLRVNELSAGYGQVAVLKGVSLNVNSAEIIAIIGANGAGKTTLLRCLSGLIPITSGEAHFCSVSLGSTSAHLLPGLGLAHVPEGRQIFLRLTVRENLELGAYSRPAHKACPDRLNFVFELFPILKTRLTQLGGTLSGGEQQMLAIARALMSNPKLLLLDEPSMGVAPILVERIFETIKLLNSSGLTVVLVEQNAHLALALAHRGYVLETGKIVLTGTGKTLLNDARVKEAYLGQ